MRGSPISLTQEEWEEIFYSVWTKRGRIERGEYGPEDTAGHHARWATDLKAIEDKIGPDGVVAARCGVAPAKSPR